MIAKIIPLTRLPRTFSFFDYQVNADFATSIKTGQLVKIPFRNKEIFGVIFDIEKNLNNDKLKEIKDIVNNTPLFSKKQLELFLLLSQVYLVSTSIFLKMSLLPLQKRKLKNIEIKLAEKNNIKTIDENTSYFFYQNSEEHQEVYKNITENTLIIVPEISQIKDILQILPENLKEKTIVWYSELSEKQKFENWLKIKNEEKTIIIGTRNTLFLPFNNLKNIIIDYEHNDNIKSWDSSPKFHAKDIVKYLQKLYNCQLTFASFSPSFEKYYEISKEKISYNKKLNTNKTLFENTNDKLPSLINYNYFSNKQNIFSLDLEDKIKNTTENVFIYINRKGYSTTTICQKCNYIETDPKTGLPLIYIKEKNILYSPYSKFSKTYSATCPKCQNELVKNYGFGIEQVADEISKLLPKENYQIFQIDKENNKIDLQEEKQNIIIGTDAAFKNIQWEKISLVIFLDIDRQLAIPEYLNIENIWHTIQEINYYRKINSEFVIPTNKVEHPLFKSLNEKDRIYRTELNNRQKLGLSPYKYLVKYYYGAEQDWLSKNKLSEATNNISQLLTKNSKNVTILGPYEMQPKYFRRQYWYCLVLKINEKNPLNLIKDINQNIPDNFKIDPNPISLLSP
ncbi:MAG: primosomal protein N' [Candidatus Magasanikbacteria bacterium]